MAQSVSKALAPLRQLGGVEALRAAAEAGLAPTKRPKVNIHVHLPPNFSAFESVAHVVELADRQHVGVLGVSNYYDYRVYADFAERARACGVFPLFGLEIIALLDELVKAGVLINDPGNPGRMYICGKGVTRFDPMSPEAERIVRKIRRNDDERMREMIARLERVFAERGSPVELGADGVADGVVRRHGCPRDAVTLQERHVAQAFQEALWRRFPTGQRAGVLEKLLGSAPASLDPVKVQGEIRSKLMKAGKPAFVAESFVGFDEAYRLILELGGIPCYPTLADGASPVCTYEDPVEKLIEQLVASDIHCVELIPVRNKPQVLRRYVTAMRSAGLVVTAGTEHNTLDLIPLEPTCLGGAPIDDDLKELFWEGACVVAAHQFLAAHGQCGFVNAEGRPNAEYGGAEERIAAFRALGAAVIQRYYETNR